MKLRASIFLLAVYAAAVAANTDWLTQVPARDHRKMNPYLRQQDAVEAGHLLFLDHCAQCHGDQGYGKNKKPSLRTQRVRSDATDGDLHWLLVNGNIRRGMPSWSKLPDPQLWQLVRYLKSLH